MLTIFVLELFRRETQSDKESDFGKRIDSEIEIHTDAQKDSKEISKEKYERLENYFMLFPLIVMLLAIIIMAILYKLFY